VRNRAPRREAAGAAAALASAEDTMAALSFPQFLHRYGIKMLVTSTPDIVPGAIIEKRKRGYFKYGHLQAILGGSDASWEHRLQPANMVYGTVERSLSLKAKASLSEFGVTIGGGLERAKAVSFFLQNVQARILVHRSKMDLIPELFRYRERNRRRWNAELNDTWVADYTYYATQVTISFETEGGVDLQADVAQHVSVSANGAVAWKSKRSFTVTTTDEVPFGFSGWKL
jgi:hypothetical protein